MIPWNPPVAPGATPSSLANAIVDIVDTRLKAGTQVEYAVESVGCDGATRLDFLEGIDCCAPEGCNPGGPIVLGTRKSGVPTLISRAESPALQYLSGAAGGPVRGGWAAGSATVAITTDSHTLPPPVRITGRVFVDAVGRMWDGRYGDYFPGARPGGTNGAYLGLAPAEAALGQVYSGSVVKSGSGTYWLGGTGRCLFTGSWADVGDHLVLYGTLTGVWQKVTDGYPDPDHTTVVTTVPMGPMYIGGPADGPYSWAGLLIPAPYAQLSEEFNHGGDGAGTRHDWISKADDSAASWQSVGLYGVHDPATYHFNSGTGLWEPVWFEGTNPFCNLWRTGNGNGPNPLDALSCGGPTPLAFCWPWPVYLGESDTMGDGFRFSSDLLASIEGNCPDYRGDNQYGSTNPGRALHFDPILTLTIRNKVAMQRIASWPLTEVTNWIMAGGPSSRFSAERAASAPWLAGVRVFPVTDGTFVVTVKDCIRAWVYEVNRTDYDFDALAARPEDPASFVNGTPRASYPWDAPTCVRLLETLDVAGGEPVGFLRAVYLT